MYTAEQARADCAAQPYYGVPVIRNLNDALQAIRHLAFSGKHATQLEFRCVKPRKKARKCGEALIKRGFVIQVWSDTMLFVRWESLDPAEHEAAKAALIANLNTEEP